MALYCANVNSRMSMMGWLRPAGNKRREGFVGLSVQVYADTKKDYLIGFSNCFDTFMSRKTARERSGLLDEPQSNKDSAPGWTDALWEELHRLPSSKEVRSCFVPSWERDFRPFRGERKAKERGNNRGRGWRYSIAFLTVSGKDTFIRLP